ncbi:ATP-binding cassette domain-containing protein [Ancylobacter sp. WKF20]|uniref:amino acid ABC transporter ATP-binding/permease protein n=1 Tax=Ancylobacter sp. WKF20 TaxID=3039801 RepID=UPI0024342575|nr:ATP-binding cassette domain-containing protein [Ancylobacter sp. WKF20]WGD29135.1 ATP-binding cassette domain-containing protein [Ancylobacter sp. WKF20]
MSQHAPGRARALLAILRLFFAQKPLALTAGIGLAVVTLVAGIALLGTAGWFITATAIAGLSTATALAFDLFAPSAVIRLLALLRTAGRYGERLVTHDAALSVLAGLRERLFRGWAAPEAAGRLADRPSRLLFRLTLDIDALDSLYLRVALPVAAALLVAAGLIGAITVIDGTTALIFAALLLGVGIGVPLVALKAARKPARRRAHVLEVLRARAVDMLAGQTDLVMAGRLGAQRAALATADARLTQADDALNRVETRIGASFTAASGVLLAVMLVLVAGLAQGGTIDAPIGALVLLVVLAAFDPFAALRRGVIEAERALIAATRLAPRLRPAAPPPAPAAPPPGLAIRLADVTLGHDALKLGGVPVLSALTLDVPRGARTAFLGTSGAGKSTLLAALAGELTPHAGALATLPSSLLTQRTELFQDSLAGNLRLAKPSASEGELCAALAQAGLADVVEALPERLESRLGEGGIGLSGGQQRRLALARLILRGAPLWLLDEPTDGLDGATARAVMAQLTACAGERTLVLATHLRREAAIADTLVLLAEGRLHTVARRGEPAYDALLARLRDD